MDRNVGSKTPVYGVLMTVVFYTTGFICGLRSLVWLAMNTLVPAASHIIALCYRHPLPNPTPPSPGVGEAGDAAGLLFKLVHTAAGHDLLVPVPVPALMYHMSAESTSGPGRIFTRLALCAPMISACCIAYFYFLVSHTLFLSLLWSTRCSLTVKTLQRGSLARTWSTIFRSTISVFPRQRNNLSSSSLAATVPVSVTTPTTRPTKTKLNPAAAPFTPSPPQPQPRRLDPTAPTFAPRGCVTPPSPAESVDSVGPATPSPSPASGVAGLAGLGKGAGVGLRVPVVVGKMRVVRPEEVVDGDRRADEVFVFF